MQGADAAMVAMVDATVIHTPMTTATTPKKLSHRNFKPRQKVVNDSAWNLVKLRFPLPLRLNRIACCVCSNVEDIGTYQQYLVYCPGPCRLAFHPHCINGTPGPKHTEEEKQFVSVKAAIGFRCSPACAECNTFNPCNFRCEGKIFDDAAVLEVIKFWRKRRENLKLSREVSEDSQDNISSCSMSAVSTSSVEENYVYKASVVAVDTDQPGSSSYSSNSLKSSAKGVESPSAFTKDAPSPVELRDTSISTGAIPLAASPKSQIDMRQDGSTVNENMEIEVMIASQLPIRESVVDDKLAQGVADISKLQKVRHRDSPIRNYVINASLDVLPAAVSMVSEDMIASISTPSVVVKLSVLANPLLEIHSFQVEADAAITTPVIPTPTSSGSTLSSPIVLSSPNPKIHTTPKHQKSRKRKVELSISTTPKSLISSKKKAESSIKNSTVDVSLDTSSETIEPPKEKPVNPTSIAARLSRQCAIRKIYNEDLIFNQWQDSSDSDYYYDVNDDDEIEHKGVISRDKEIRRRKPIGSLSSSSSSCKDELDSSIAKLQVSPMDHTPTAYSPEDTSAALNVVKLEFTPSISNNSLSSTESQCDSPMIITISDDSDEELEVLSPQSGEEFMVSP